MFVAIEHRPERLLPQIFAECCVRPSAKEGVLGDSNKLDISGNGTCIKSGGSPYGIKVCDCIKKVYTIVNVTADFLTSRPDMAGMQVILNIHHTMPSLKYIS